MSNRTTVNVKNVEISLWERSGEIAKAERWDRGDLVNAALRQLIRAYDEPGAMAQAAPSPAAPAPSAPAPVDHFRIVEAINGQMQGVAALAQAAAANPKLSGSIIARAASLLDDSMRIAQGLPPKARGGEAAGDRPRDERGRFAALPAPVTSEAAPSLVEERAA